MDKPYTKHHININLDYEKIRTLLYERKSVPLSQEERWRALGYNQKHVNGSMYSMPDSEDWCEPELRKITNSLKLKNCGFVFYKMQTMDVMPNHSDHFETYSRLFNVNTQDIFRAVVFLQPWKSGHYFEINGDPIINWNYGDYVMWQGDVPHMAANIGLEDRYTLQVTGMSNAL